MTDVSSATPIMAQAVAVAIGATKRQVQIWTDAGAIRCIPETDRQGRGRQRLYDPVELPIAALVATMAKFQIPIGRIKEWSDVVRKGPVHGKTEGGEVVVDGPNSKSRQEWVTDALRGKIKSFIAFYIDEEGDFKYLWLKSEGLGPFFGSLVDGGIVISVHKVVNRIPH